MKKAILILVLSLVLLTGNVYAKTVKALVENVSIDDVKSKLIDIHLDQGYEIGEETSNKITFIKERKGTLTNLLTAFVSDNVKSYDRDSFNLSKRDNGVVIYYKTEVFSGDEVFKLDSDKLADSMQEWLDGFVKKNF